MKFGNMGAPSETWALRGGSGCYNVFHWLSKEKNPLRCVGKNDEFTGHSKHLRHPEHLHQN